MKGILAVPSCYDRCHVLACWDGMQADEHEALEGGRYGVPRGSSRTEACRELYCEVDGRLLSVVGQLSCCIIKGSLWTLIVRYLLNSAA